MKRNITKKIKGEIKEMYKQNNTNEKDKNTKKFNPIKVHGIWFDNICAAGWGALFIELGIEFEYKPGKIRLKSGRYFEPDFILHHLVGRVEGAIYASICRNDEDYAEMVDEFVSRKDDVIDRPLLILDKVFPYGDSMGEIDMFMTDKAYDGVTANKENIVYPYNFETIDGDYYCAFLGLNKDGKPELFGEDSSYLEDRDDRRTFHAYEYASFIYFSR